MPLERIQRGSSILTIGLLATLPSAKIHQLMQRLCSRDPKLGLTWHLNLSRSFMDSFSHNVTTGNGVKNALDSSTYSYCQLRDPGHSEVVSLPHFPSNYRPRSPTPTKTMSASGKDSPIMSMSTFGGCEWMWGRFLQKQFTSCIVVAI